MPGNISVFWFRRDLRLDDNTALYHALRSGKPVLPVFIFDVNILQDLKDRHDKRVSFISDALAAPQARLVALGSTLHVLHGDPVECFEKLLIRYSVGEVYANGDYEPYAVKRDRNVRELLEKQGVAFTTCKDHVLFEKNELLKSNGTPYTVFTPYSKRWLEKLETDPVVAFDTARYFDNFYKQQPLPLIPLLSLGFEYARHNAGEAVFDYAVARNYDKTRDYPAVAGTTRLSVHLRFGTISIREVVSKAQAVNDTLLKELIWREFYQMILWHYPQVVHQSFKKEYDNIAWRNDDREFALWCSGNTGYPIVDAGMRELNETGYMHNRVRMITASFLTKHLLTDWRRGEAYFAEKLLDYDLAANNGNWQWAAGSGCDAAPYFRVFNPYRQAEKFDPALVYIRKWVPELESAVYPEPVVEHQFARERCLRVYRQALKGGV